MSNQTKVLLGIGVLLASPVIVAVLAAIFVAAQGFFAVFFSTVPGAPFIVFASIVFVFLAWLWSRGRSGF